MLSDLQLLPEYRSFEHDIVNEFYIPTLKKSIEYKRAVGYFSSSALVQITKGIKGLIENTGKIKMLASPYLSKEDIVAIEEGYKKREEVIESSLQQFFLKEELEESNLELKERFNLLAWLIKYDFLEIKLAVLNNGSNIGMYHEKIGIITDGENRVAFSGSMNETGAAINYNYESFDVFTTWQGDPKRVDLKEDAFDRLWNNEMKNVNTIKFPKALKDQLVSEVKEPDFEFLEKIESPVKEPEVIKEPVPELVPSYYPKIPEFIDLRDYQKDAIKNWKDENYRGIFDMATGTGKTITGLAAATRLYENNNERLAIIIVVPYQHLVEQWVEDIVAFNMNPIIAYSSSSDKKWRDKLDTNVKSFSYGVSSHFCLVITNATYRSEYVQKLLKRLSKDTLLLVDEAHNFGAKHLQENLLNKIPYRLGLSATIERHGDPEGTQALYNYFGKKSIEYTLEDAIENGMLTPYYYYPIVVSLTEEEREEYKNLTSKIIQNIMTDKFGRVSFSESAKILLIKRARLIAGAHNKMNALSKEIDKVKDQSNILVYCGATTILDATYVEGDPAREELRQIDVVTDLLGNQHNMKVSQFTSKESSVEREEIKELFAEGEDLQALIAIRCLDEGVDIPKVQTAFILASSTNPKEYIQRRGRVLRLAKNKDHAVIYDFITLPDEQYNLRNLSNVEVNNYRGLINRELVRMRDFAKVSINSSVADELIFELEDLFNLYNNEEEGLNESNI